jgi:histidinol phosphatase-like enzyme
LDLRPGVVPILKALVRENYSLFLVMNTPEILEGRFDLRQLHQFFNALQEYWYPANIEIVQIYYESNIKHKRALPKPQMFIEICDDYNYKPKDLVVVGCEYFDESAAKSGNFDFISSRNFFNTLVPQQLKS